MYYSNQPILMSPATDGDDDGSDHTGPTSRGRSIARFITARRINSFGRNTPLSNLGGGGVRCGESSGEQVAADDDDSTARMKRCQTAPGYVSFEDVIGGEAAWFGRESRRRLQEADGAIITDPLVRAASRLYAGDAAHLQPPRHCRRSPGPLGTRRGSFVHGLVKKYVSPCLGFLSGAFFCGSDASATCPMSPCDCK